MATNQLYKKKLDSEGNPMTDINGEFIMEVESVEAPEPIIEEEDLQTKAQRLADELQAVINQLNNQ